jgi:hypothetical protein
MTWCIDAVRGLIRQRGVTDGSDGVRPLPWSDSAPTAYYGADVWLRNVWTNVPRLTEAIEITMHSWTKMILLNEISIPPWHRITFPETEYLLLKCDWFTVPIMASLMHSYTGCTWYWQDDQGCRPNIWSSGCSLSVIDLYIIIRMARFEQLGMVASGIRPCMVGGSRTSLVENGNQRCIREPNLVTLILRSWYSMTYIYTIDFPHKVAKIR